MTRPEVERWSEHPDLVEYYGSARNRPEDLYPSERRFLAWLAREARTVLDVGCAAGGFAAIYAAYNPAIAYTGADLSHSLFEAARALHPEAEFVEADAVEGLPFGERSFDVVQALGWVHWEHEHRAALRELWRVTASRLFFDVRLKAGDDAGAVEGHQRLALTGDWDGRTEVPYIALAWPEFAAFLGELGAERILGHGYLGDPSDTVSEMQEKVCFATFVLEKPAAGPPSEPLVCLDAPLSWPPGAGAADVRPPAELGTLVPEDAP